MDRYMRKHYSMNSRAGRTAWRRDHMRELRAKAQAAGVDVADRQAFARWRAERSREFYATFSDRQNDHCLIDYTLLHP